MKQSVKGVNLPTKFLPIISAEKCFPFQAHIIESSHIVHVKRVSYFYEEEMKASYSICDLQKLSVINTWLNVFFEKHSPVLTRSNFQMSFSKMEGDRFRREMVKFWRPVCVSHCLHNGNRLVNSLKNCSLKVELCIITMCKHFITADGRKSTWMSFLVLFLF